MLSRLFFKNVITQNRKFKLKTAALWLSLTATAVLFVLFSDLQNQKMNPNNVRKNLIDQRAVLEIKSWNAEFSQCLNQPGGVYECETLNNSPIAVTIPGKNALEKVTSKLPKQPTHVTLSHQYTAQEKTWIEDALAKEDASGNLVFVVPRPLQNSARFELNNKSQESSGVGTAGIFTASQKDFQGYPALKLTFNFDGYSWFGPTDSPMIFALPNKVDEYLSLSSLQQASNFLAKVPNIGVPLVLALLACILDHSKPFAFLSLYAGARGLRSYLTSQSENSSLSLLMEGSIYIVNGFTLVLLLLFVASLCQAGKYNPLAKFSLSLLLTASVGFGVIGFLNRSFFLQADSWSDFAGATAGFLWILGATLHSLKETHKNKWEDAPEWQRSLIRNAIAAAGLLLYALVNIEDLNLKDGDFKQLLDWKIAAFLPILTSATMIKIGSTSKGYEAVIIAAKKKAVLEKDLAMGREFQQQMLPSRRETLSSVQYRSFYYPAAALAGDWFDIRELIFLDGKKLTIAVIADVVGHGVRASLTTGVISSHWGNWCDEVIKREAPVSPEKELVVGDVLRRINAGLRGMRSVENATIGIVLIDSQFLEITFAQAGHHGALIFTKDEVKMLMAPPGPSIGRGLPDEVWIAKTQPLVPDSRICLFSDGLFPVESDAARWIPSLRREAKKSGKNFELLLLKQLSKNRRHFRENRQDEDDITLLFLKPNSH